MLQLDTKRQLGLPEDCILLSLFGFIASYKGHETAVRAMNALSDRYRLAIVGGPHPEGGDKTIETMLKLSRKFGGNRLTIAGYVDQDEPDLYHAATDVCLAPYNDPTLASSAAITWAISSGKPVVASNIPTFREINEMHDCLLTVNPDCPEELAWQIEKLIANPAKQEELVANAEKYSLACSWDRVIDQMLPAYEELLRKKLPTAYSRCETAPTAHIGVA